MSKWCPRVLAVLAALGVGVLVYIASCVDRTPGGQPVVPDGMAAEVYIHGYVDDPRYEGGIAGVSISLFYEGRLIRTKITDASGRFGFGDTAKLGVYQLRIEPPAGYRMTGALRAPNVTDYKAEQGVLSFRVSPAGGATGVFVIFLERESAPVATPTPSPSPAAPTPTWTPGPTPTLCFAEIPPKLRATIIAEMSAVFPPPQGELTQLGWTLGLGWPMLAREYELDGVRYAGQLWTPFTVIVDLGNGCYGVLDSFGLLGGPGPYVGGGDYGMMSDMIMPERAELVQAMIRALAPHFGVDPDFAVEIARLESSFQTDAVGDRGKAVGLWQWWLSSWEYVRHRMGLSVEDRRRDAFESTITALYAIGKLGLERWWSTARIARARLEGARGR